MIIIVVSLLASLCFALSSLLAQRGLHIVPTPWGVWITLLFNTAFLWSLQLYLDPGAPVLVAANIPFVLIGLFVPGLTRLLIFRSIRMMGSSVTSTVINSTPMFSTAMAILFLGERPGSLVLSGVGLIIGGLMTLSWGRGEGSWGRAELLYPMLATFLFASKDVVARWGIGATGQPVLAAAVAATVATLEVFLILRCLQGERFSLPPARVTFWFVMCGFSTGGAFLFTFLALFMGEVSVVSPIINSFSVFVFLLAPLLAPKIEVVTARKLLGVLGVVLGVFTVSLARN